MPLQPHNKHSLTHIRTLGNLTSQGAKSELEGTAINHGPRP